MTRPCPCGSGKPSQALHDVAGIYLKRVCSICRAAVMRAYQPWVFDATAYANNIVEAVSDDDDFDTDPRLNDDGDTAFEDFN
jgi:hypothetical protein